MRRAYGFTIIELLVVMSVIALLLTIAAPRYFRHVDEAKEAVLRESLHVMRDAIDRYRGDRGRYPSSLDELVKDRYLRAVPVDPITERHDTWVVLPPRQGESAVYDVRSGATGRLADGTAYGAL